MPTTSRGAPFPAGNSSNNVPVDIQALAEWVNGLPGVTPLATAARDALTGQALWDGRIIWNTSTLTLERYDATATPNPVWRAAALSEAAASTAYVRRAGGDTITASAATVKPLVVRGAASQTANLLEWQNDAGVVRSYVEAGGAFRFGPGAQGHDVNAWASVATGGPAAKGLVVRGAASQTANLAEFQNSAGTVMLAVRPTGRLAFQFNGDTSSFTAVAGNNGAPPAAVQGYLHVELDGAVRKIPYYLP